MTGGGQKVKLGDGKKKNPEKVISELAFWGKVNSHQISDSVLHSSHAAQELMSQRVTDQHMFVLTD